MATGDGEAWLPMLGCGGRGPAPTAG